MQAAHPDWVYQFWTDENVPVMPRHAQDLYDDFYRRGEYAYACDILRYFLLADRGGVYLDCDFAMSVQGSLNLLPLDKDTILVNQRKHPDAAAGNFKYRLQNCFMASAPNAAFARRVLETLGNTGYVLTDLRRRKCKKYSCQYITTEYWAHVTKTKAKRVTHLIRHNLNELSPPNECILGYEYFFGNEAIIAKHLYVGSHKRTMNRDQLITHLNLTGLGIEIGVQKGKFAKTILDRSSLHLILLDSWRFIEGYKDRANQTTKTHTVLLKHTINSLVEKHEGRFTVMRELSEVAVNFFKDELFDFAYFDANHSEEFVYNQLVMWWPKLKPGAWVAGHDYINKTTETNEFGVKSAVDKFFSEKSMTVNVTVESGFPSWYIQKGPTDNIVKDATNHTNVV